MRGKKRGGAAGVSGQSACGASRAARRRYARLFCRDIRRSTSPARIFARVFGARALYFLRREVVVTRARAIIQRGVTPGNTASAPNLRAVAVTAFARSVRG